MDSRENTGRHSHLMIILVSVLIGAVLAALLLAQQDRNGVLTPAMAQQQVVTQFEGVAERVLPAVVYINSDIPQAANPQQQEMQRQLEELFRQMPGWRRQMPEGGGGNGEAPMPESRPAAGSGWIYDQSGHIVTNAHVVRGATRVTVRLHDKEGDTREYPARIVGIDPRSELAVIKVDAGRNLPFLSLGDSDQAQIASWVMAVGSPFQLQQTVTVGVVSARGRTIGGESEYFRIGDLIQTDASINPGNSGGPLVNLRGEVIGINVAIASPGATSVPFNIGIGFSIPSNVAKMVVPELIRSGRVARGWLGIVIRELNDNLREHFGVQEGGVLITQVNPDAPASRALQPNDVVVSIGGQPIRTSWDLQSKVASAAPGSRLNMEIVRNKQRQQVAVELGEMPARYAGLEEPEAAAPAEGVTVGPKITVRNITPELAQARSICRAQGVYVEAVTDPELRDRIQRNDVIIKVGDQDVANVAEYQAAIKAAVDARRSFVVLTLERMGPDGLKMTDVVDVPLQ